MRLYDQLNQLFDPSMCFLYDGRVYEIFKSNMGKIEIRKIISEDDYDYVINPFLRRRLRYKAVELGILK